MATAFSPRERERIRDSLLDAALKSAASQGMRHATVDEPVSYTHLTLPTNREV